MHSKTGLYSIPASIYSTKSLFPFSEGCSLFSRASLWGRREHNRQTSIAVVFGLPKDMIFRNRSGYENMGTNPSPRPGGRATKIPRVATLKQGPKGAAKEQDASIANGDIFLKLQFFLQRPRSTAEVLLGAQEDFSQPTFVYCSCPHYRVHLCLSWTLKHALYTS